MDREKVKKGVWQCWLPSTEEEYATQCHDCPYYEPGITLEECMTALRTDVLALLQEQEEEIENLKQTCQSMMEGICLLKEQDNCENCAIAIEDRQPIVRCKDCKYQVDRGRRYKDCDQHFLQAKDNWFCADGERR